jgi:hypothetical protein
MIRRLLVAALCALAVAAPAGADGGPAPGIVQGRDGALAPAGSVRYVALPARGSTLVAVVRVRDGRVLRFRVLRGDWGVPVVARDGTTGGVTPDGATLVLSSSPPAVGSGGRSRFAFVSTNGLRIRSVAELRGTYSFDALSPDAGTLYLIQHVSASGPRYRVRAFDVASGRLLPRPIADKRTGQTAMGGLPLTRAAGRDGQWIYTLYRNDGGLPFVHTLDAVNRSALCIFLPWRGSQAPLAAARLRLSRSESELVVERGAERIALIDTQALRVVSG